MSRPSSSTAWVQFFPSADVQIWSSSPLAGREIALENFLGGLPPVERRGAARVFFWHATGRLDEAALEVAALARICVALEPDFEDAVRWVRAGGLDYWPLSLLSPEEIRTRVAALAERPLLTAKREIEPLDPLTELPGIAALEDALREAGTDTEWACFFIDVDHFKSVNDRCGHLVGSSTLRRLAELLRGALRGGDQLYRYGGDEFVVLLKPRSRADAIQVAERLRETVALDSGAEAGPQTVSIGVAFGHGLSLLQNADEALYEAKRNLRNQVCVFAGERGLSCQVPESSLALRGGTV